MARDLTPGQNPAPKKGASGLESLSGDMRTLSGVIGDLEDQLDRMIAANEALTEDLTRERTRCAAADAQREELSERLARAEHELAGNENLHGEVSQLHHERTRLSASIRELEAQLETAVRERDRQSQLAARLRAARADTVEEVQSVEVQFERAMQVVARLTSQLTAVSEGRDASRAECRVYEEKLRETQRERDVLQNEVEASRAALDEIRRSLLESAGTHKRSGE